MELGALPEPHPIVRCAGEIEAALDRVAETDPTYLRLEEKKSALVDLARQAERVRGLLLKILAVAEDVAADEGARSPAAWLAHHVHADHAAGMRAGRLAERLDAKWHGVQEALSSGKVSEEQAVAIVAALDALPADLDRSVLQQAENHLVAEGARFTPRQLRVLGRRVLDVIAPDAAGTEERRQLEAEERRALRRTQLFMRQRGDGVTDISLRVPDAVAARLKVYLESFTSPRRSALASSVERDHLTGQRLTRPQRLGMAFCALLEALPAEVLPQHGGSATTLLVNLDLEQLMSGLGSAELSTGDVISAGEARRLACSAGLVPVVLGSKSEPLDLGRSARLFNSAQRKALAIRDKVCRAEGCTIPAAWCEAHHAAQPWSHGGRTDVADGQLLCSFHHHRAHDDRYDKLRLSNGDVRFILRR